MTRAAHQDIDRLADTLGQRAEIEGLAKGVRLTLRRTLLRWALGWSFALAAAGAVAVLTPWLWWLPVAALAVALLSLAATLVHRTKTTRRIDAARDRLAAAASRGTAP